MERAQEISGKTLCNRGYALNLPQMHWGGMSENWLLKELGDMHWAMIAEGLGVKSGDLVNGNGERLYASFVRLRWESNASLFSFKENQDISLNGELSRYGSKMFFSDTEVTCSDKKIKASLMSVFSTLKGGDNKELKIGTPLASDSNKINAYSELPKFAKEYIRTKSELSTPTDKFKDIRIDLAGTSFPLDSKTIYTRDYKIEPVDDVNGVGLLYFASFSKICDKCERPYFHELNKANEKMEDWAYNASCIARDIFYFGNANAEDELIYNLDSCQFVGENKIELVSSLYRKGDGHLIGKIFTIKELSESIKNKVNSLPSPLPHQKEVGENTGHNRENITKSILDFLSSMVGVEHMTEVTDLRLLGLESVIFMELSEHLSNTFGIQSNPSRFYGLSTVKDIVDYVLQGSGQAIEEEKSSSTTKRVKNTNPPDPDAIAIIGTSFRMPGAANKEELWEMLITGKSAIGERPKERWTWPEWLRLNTTDKGIDRGGYLKDIDKFDASFFRISPREAELMDPQQRLLLELTWELLEEAGYKASAVRGSKTGVYIGASGSDYELLLREQTGQETLTGTGTSPALMANRISYFFDFNGPSLQIDTACSSSLVALHEAVNAIRSGDCTQAIAGAIHLMCHSSRSLAYHHSNMLSVDGKCQTFDDKANGYVRAEGSVLLFLKPLTKAIEDGDYIHGIIKSTAVNHGGQSGGLTVPNPEKQRQLVEDAYKKAEIDITTVNYIEVHGTGTSLGDPIEVAGLTAAFKNLRADMPGNKSLPAPWCGLGSIKTNVGHLEAASGMAGIMKVLLSMEHRQLPPTINFKNLNTKIELEGSPFHIQNEPGPWQPVLPDESLRAGVSSFGIGGANGHVVLESFYKEKKNAGENAGPYLFVLSARNSERLKDYVRLIVEYIGKKADINPSSLSYTMQTTREEMEERLAVVYQDLNELKSSLSEYINESSLHLYTGNIKRDIKSIEIFRQDRAIIKEWLNTKQLQNIAKYWCYGATFDWSLLYPDNIPDRISLPTYPFARERYWIPEMETREKHDDSSRLHPLLHYNSSTLKEQKYTSIYTGSESFLSDHKVREEKVLPGVAYLELAREAGARSTGEKINWLKDVTWLSPIRVNEIPEKVSICLYSSGEEVGYEVYRENGGQEQVSSQGKLSTKMQQAPERQNPEAIRQRLFHTKEHETCYSLFKAMGLDYGKSFRGIEKLYYSEEEALSRISLPNEDGYILNPGILDSALQTCIGLGFAKGDQVLSLPFSVREVNIYQDLPKTIWCYARKSKNNKANGKVVSYDIDLLNNNGEVLLSFRDFVMLPLDSLSKKTFAHLYSNSWQLSEQVTSSHEETNATQLVLLAGAPSGLADKLTETLQVEVRAINQETTEACFMNLLETVKEKLKTKEPANIMVVCQSADYIDYGFVSGLLKTATRENPKITGKIIVVESLSVRDLEELTKILESEQRTMETEVRYSGGNREVKTLQSVSGIINMSIKEGGVYLITGGAGGLGRIFAEHISKTKNTKLILTGRSELKESILEIPGAIYYRCDVSNKDEVFSLIKTIKEKYQKLDGIIHSAGVIRDSFIIKKTAVEVTEVFSPKIAGVRNLDEATKEEALDFMVFFSSISGILGNTGQADYASANAYLDNYAHHREELRIRGKRQGKTLSINWPLWKEGGMQVDPASAQYLETQWGMLPLPAEEGIKAFEALLGSTISQGIVAFGSGEKISRVLLNKGEKTQQKAPLKDTGNSKSAIEAILIEMCSALLKLSKENLDTETDFSEYGVDSIMMMKILNMLEARFEIAMEPTAIVSYPTISLLAGYLEEEKSLTLKESTPIKDNENNIAPAIQIRPERPRFGRSSKNSGKVAIIGMSCKLPESDNLDEYWQNLRLGKDLISETPTNRWDASNYYSANTTPGKTYTTKGGFLKTPGLFDARYFKISDEEAIAIDPQQRIILELSRDLLSHAGYRKEELANTKTGVYIGAKDNNYLRNNYHLLPAGTHQHTVVNSISNMIAARVSDFYDLKGTSQVIDTACSSSLVAIHQACDDILNGKTTMAIAGGVSIMVDVFGHIGFSQAEVLSRDGRCYVFDERAAGFVMGEGAGLLMLKDYDQALADGDRIIGIVTGSSVNNDGQTMGLTVPNKEGQKEVIKETLEKAGISPEEITYYEAHGTGTLLGDPIEIKAATEVYRASTANKQYCAIGSVKSNLGHTMMAAGVTGLIKILLQMEHNQLAPTLHCESLHPRFKFEESPFYPNTKLREWNADKKIAAISSFGFGGTNCHMVIEKPAAGNTLIKRAALPVERLSNNSYWLGTENNNPLKEESPIKEKIIYDEPLMRDHQLFGKQVLMGVAHLAMSIDTGFRQYPGKALRLEKVLFSNPLVLVPGEIAQLKSITDPASNRVSVEYEIDGKVNISSTCELNQFLATEDKMDVAKLKKDSVKELEAEQFYVHRDQSCYGSTLRTVQKVWYLPNGDLLASLRVSDEQLKHTQTFTIHPALLDGAHVASTLCLHRDIEKSVNNHWPPLMIKAVEVMGDSSGFILQDYYCYISPVKSNAQIAEFNIKILNPDGATVVHMPGFTTKSVPDPASLFGEKTSKPISSPANHDMQITSYLQNKIGEVLRKPQTEISVAQNFMDMGLNSGQMIGISQQIEKELDIELYPTLFFEYQNIEDLVGYFNSDHAGKLAEKFGKNNGEILQEIIPEAGKPLPVEQKSSTPEKAVFKHEEISRKVEQSRMEDIAIIGMSGYLPQSADLTEFWDHIQAGRDLVTEIPEGHWDYKPWFDENREAANKTYSKWGGFLKDIDKFDPLFFGIAPLQATWMDPQLRLLLQSTYHTFEDAGVVNEIKGSRTGVYVGSCFHEYWDEIVRAQTSISDYQHTSSIMSGLSASVSYHFDLQGASVPLDNACASSLTALHLGCQAIRNGEIDTAVIGGLNVLLSPLHYVYFSRMQALSPTGRCHTFDKKADGYVPGEGVVSILIKPLSKAIADGNKIHGIIKGSAINHVGKSNNPTSPRPELQTRLLIDAWNAAGINPESISYLEAHGTGTGLGDPIEINALKRAFKQYTDKEGFCTIGSTKAHAGHLEAAAGLTSVIKVLLMMKHRTIPAMPNFEELNPYIKIDGSPFIINRSNEPWKSDKPLIAGVSSFGMTGNNAHVVIEEYQSKDITAYSSSSPVIILLSARDKDRLKAIAGNLKNYLQSDPGVNLHDIAYTLQTNREFMDERLALVAKDKEELTTQLTSYLEGETNHLITGNIKKDKSDFLLEGEAGKGYIEMAIKHKESKSLARLWVKGISLDWTLLYPDQKPNKISLPMYPFARERYWIPLSSAITLPAPQKNISLLTERESVVFTEGWQPITLKENRSRPGKVLVLSDGSSIGLIKELERAFDTITVVSPGIEYPGYLKDVAGLIDLSALENEAGIRYEWIGLIQKLIEKSESLPLKLLIVSNGTSDVENLKGAERFGLYHMLQAEYSKVDSLHIHINRGLQEKEQGKLIIDAYNSQNQYTNLKNLQGSWHHPVLKSIILRKPAAFSITYPVLITGGTRGIGMTCAKHLVLKHNVTKLILLGKDELPTRESWESMRTEDSPLGRKISDILFLEQAGADVIVLNTPLLDKERLKASLDDVQKLWGPIKGLLHCAGYIDTEDAVFINKTVQNIANLQMPKVAGLNNLHEALREQATEFAILFSSISALVPMLAAGFSDYAMANSYMDHFAVYQRSQGYNYTSIQWPSWKETGMGEVKGGAYEDLGQLSITNKEALEILDAVISDRGLPALIFPAVYEPSKFDKDTLLMIPGKGIPAEYSAVRANVLPDAGDWLKELVSNVLGMQAQDLDMDTALQEYGVDSITLSLLVKRLETKIADVRISPTVILENPTIRLLSDYLKEHYSKELSGLLNKSDDLVSAEREPRSYTKQSISNTESETRRNIPDQRKPDNTRIAVIGMACHFPDADNLSAYWENLKQGKDSIREVPESRWAIEDHYDAEGKTNGKSISKWGAFLNRIEDFDPAYFGINPSLASFIDPLERQWLEVSAEAIADSGYAKEDLWGKRIGVYAGSRASNFSDKISKNHKDVIVGVGQNFITAHLAHIYNLKGPNMVIDTACSSSITAIDLAVRGLLTGETELALAGGVDILLDEKSFITLSTAEVLSPDGKCRTFDERANGIGLGEGCGVLVLKRLEDAIASGDKVYGVIEGTAANNDGNTMGITTPNPEAQLSLMKDAVIKAGIDTSTISYIETHGTGTLIGDPIELKAITRLLETDGRGKGTCGVGSVKSNIGHLLSAAGIAGVIKTLLSITAGQLPPTLHCEKPNPRFDFANSPVYPVTQLQHWNGVDGIRRAGVSAFGLGGSNAHVLLSNAGIPDANRVQLPFTGPSIYFQRQRYWPKEEQVIFKQEKTNRKEAFQKYLHFTVD
ncbi:probable biosynthetic protein, Pnap_2097 family [Chitinophaga sp. CF118]|uniref:SDR family NAD(P)-dependent oxidoreductase n=1 Tax=Chitinophaga sp. CF118 TaxID=1884367 RepID=UPI0008E2A60E|nr:SDR family NAD(P)-dependent oxidoreductase [Chitinophaga sp. CF118]SFE51876.1 probable biosynthetic protein, Pnap_2097 family [Chitinophaga sp. CF118]